MIMFYALSALPFILLLAAIAASKAGLAGLTTNTTVRFPVHRGSPIGNIRSTRRLRRTAEARQ
jgi:hypothetical protein